MYQKGRVQFEDLDITIKNPKGTKGIDGDPLDVFLGDNFEPESVFIVDQIDPKTRELDEHKIMLGFSSKQEARKAYLANYDENWMGLGKLNAMKLDKFKAKEDGFSLENISEVMGYWLKENPQD